MNGVREVSVGAAAKAMCTLALIASMAVSTWTAAPVGQPGVSERNQDRLDGRPVVLLLADILSAGNASPFTLDAATAYAQTRGLVGVSVIDRQTGRYVDNGAGAHTAMGSASVIKVILAEEILHLDAIGRIQLGPSEYSRLDSMLVSSDDPAASSLYGQFGGISLILHALRRHDLTESSAPADPQYWGNTKISAHDMATFYDNVLAGSLPPSSRDYLVGLLRRIAPVASDGFGQIFGLAAATAAAAPSTVAAIKQGWMCCLDGVRSVHSTAILGASDRYVVTILTQFSPALSWDYGLTTTTEVARLILAELDR